MRKKDISNYRGESPGKKEARLIVHETNKDELGKRAFIRGPHLVIASQQAGDVSVLLEMGVKPQSIYAIDIDRHELAAAKSRYAGSGVNFHHCDFKNAHRELGVERFETALIDLCAPIRIATLREVLKLNATITGLEFMCCRELGSVARYVRQKKQKHPARSRLDYLKMQGFHPFVCLYYVSRTETTNGNPMGIVLRTGRRRPKSPTIVDVNATYREQRRKITYSTGPSMGNLYNIPKETVACWRSWEIRWEKTTRRWYGPGSR